MTTPRGLSEKPEAPTMPTPRCIKFNLEKPGRTDTKLVKTFQFDKMDLNSLHIFRGVPLFWGGIAHCAKKLVQETAVFFVRLGSKNIFFGIHCNLLKVVTCQDPNFVRILWYSFKTEAPVKMVTPFSVASAATALL